MEKDLTKKLVGIISLGCDKNRVDTEIMLTYLQNAGFQFTNDPQEAQILIINTCAFIEKARKEALDTVDEMLAYKKHGKCEKIIVTGCMPQKYLPLLKEEFPKVDAFLGIDHYPEIVDIIDQLYQTKKQLYFCGNADTIPHIDNRVITTPEHYAYLKIADGCENYCTFCTIPFIRGKYRSKPIDQVVDEAKALVNGGAKELILVAQDVTKYGVDFSGKPALVDLIHQLSKIKKLMWIRLLYCYPEQVTDELLDEMVNNPKLCNYLDIPFQHVSDNVLKMMNRHIDYNGIVNLIEKINALPQKIAIRTTFMVGFPGETEEDHKLLCEFIKKYNLAHVGFFEYSKEEGTVASKMQNQVPARIKRKRFLELIAIAEKNKKQQMRKSIGQTAEVIYEGIDYDLQMFYGRTQYQAPEIDNLVLFKSRELVKIGQFYNITITGSIGDDLKGEKV